jgi:hypothetical protein
MRARVILVALILLAALAVALGTPSVRADDPDPNAPTPAPTATRPAAPTAAATPGPAPSAATAFQRAWERSDSPAVRGARPYLWGPQPVLPTISEPLAGVVGQRPVIYWDKGRMEINDTKAPYDAYYVSNGRLVAELVTGRQQVGIKPDRFAERGPAQIPFGDLDDPTGPTFASFGGRLNDPPLAVGAPVAQALDRAGALSATDADGVACATVVAATRHCIAAPFQEYLDQTGPLLNQGRVTTGRLFDPPFALTGLPIAEPYWITVKVAGKPTRVLIQLFERRTLTYNPANAAGARVEMGNVGLEYYHWRYDAVVPSDPQTGLDPTLRQAETLIYEANPSFRPLITNLAGGRYQLLLQDIASLGAYGATSERYHVILFDTAFAKLDNHDLAGVMAHEAQHAADLTASGGPVTANECYAFELRGFLVGSAIWQAFYGPNGKPNPSNTFELRENAILLEFRQNPARFVKNLQTFYARECDTLGPGAPDRFLTLANLPAGIETQLPVAQAFAALRQPALAERPLPGLQAADNGSPMPVDDGSIAGIVPAIDRGSRHFMEP